MKFNDLIMEKLQYVTDKATCMTILYGVYNKANLKLFRDCRDEFKELKELFLLEEVDGEIRLTHDLWEKEIRPSTKQSTVNVSKAKAFKKESVHDWIEEWRSLFPVRSVTNLRYHVTGDRQACLKRMHRFLLDYEYDKNTIIEATKLYLAEQKNNGWQYTIKAHKFIQSENGSVLSEYCELINSGQSRKIDDETSFKTIA